jgi:phosphoribosylformylglycinamidine (FGAM) synthase-like enzyme
MVGPRGEAGGVTKGREDLEGLVDVHREVAALIAAGEVRSAHDVSDGGWLTAAAEMSIAGRLGLVLTHGADLWLDRRGTYLLEVTPAVAATLGGRLGSRVSVQKVGEVVAAPEVTLGKELRWSLEDLTTAFRGGLQL